MPWEISAASAAVLHEPDHSALLEATLECADEAVLAVGADGRVVACNAMFGELCSLAPDLVRGADAPAILAHITSMVEDPPGFAERVVAAREPSAPAFHECVRLRDGRVLECRSRPLVVGAGPSGRVWALREVTERERNEERLRVAVRRLREAHALAHIGSWEKEVDAESAVWSEELYRIFGVDRSKFRPTLDDILECYVPEDRPRLLAAVEGLVRHGTPMDVRGRITRGRGETVVVHSRARAVRDEHGRVVRLIGTVQDVTERHRAGEALRAAEARFRAAFDSAPVGAALIGPDGSIRRANRALARDTGYSQDDLALLSIWDIVDWEPGDEALVREFFAGDDGGAVDRRFRTGDGRERWAAISASVLRDDSGGPQEIIARFLDVTDRKRDHERLEHHAHHDALTGLLNASAFHARLGEALRAADGAGDAPAVIHLSLDRFKAVNEALGRPAGDRILVAIAQRLRAAAGGEAVVARLGGDEFAMLLPAASSEATVRDAAAQARKAVALPLRVGDAIVNQQSSAGLALALNRGASPDDLLREAESAAGTAKQAGGAREALFDEAARRRLHDDIRLGRDLRSALREDALEMAFQPIVDLQTGAIAGLEALLRWQHPELGEISPGRFVPIAEQMTLIVPLGEWVVRNVCDHIAQWQRAGLRVGPVAVNVSARQLDQPAFAQRLHDNLRESGIAPESVSIEVTEGALLQLPVSPDDVLQELRSIGFRVVLDDFGTGYSSLSHLKRFPVTGLKIDRSFVGELPEDPHATAIVEGVIAMGRAVGVDMVAEGVESPAQADFVRSLGCPLAQGWLFSRPLAPSRVPTVLEQGLPAGAAEDALSPENTVTLGEAAEALGVSPNTVRRWADAGRIRALRTAGGHRRFRRSDVEREAARVHSGPVVRPSRMPDRPLPRATTVLQERAPWIAAVTLRTVYVGDDYGWFGTPGGRAAMDRWLHALAEAVRSGDYARALDATNDFLGTARRAGAPLIERVAIVDAVGQAVRSALAEGGGTGELPQFGRLVAALRRVAVAGP